MFSKAVCCSRQLWKRTRNCLETPFTWKYNNCTELKTWWQKEKLLILSNFFFCCHVFKKLSAAEASESVYMRWRDKFPLADTFLTHQLPTWKTLWQKEKLYTRLLILFNNYIFIYKEVPYFLPICFQSHLGLVEQLVVQVCVKRLIKALLKQNILL